MSQRDGSGGRRGNKKREKNSPDGEGAGKWYDIPTAIAFHQGIAAFAFIMFVCYVRDISVDGGRWDRAQPMDPSAAFPSLHFSIYDFAICARSHLSKITLAQVKKKGG